MGATNWLPSANITLIRRRTVKSREYRFSGLSVSNVHMPVSLIYLRIITSMLTECVATAITTRFPTTLITKGPRKMGNFHCFPLIGSSSLQGREGHRISTPYLKPLHQESSDASHYMYIYIFSFSPTLTYSKYTRLPLMNYSFLYCICNRVGIFFLVVLLKVTYCLQITGMLMSSPVFVRNDFETRSKTMRYVALYISYTQNQWTISKRVTLALTLILQSLFVFYQTYGPADVECDF
jgi:hypothetical protein